MSMAKKDHALWERTYHQAGNTGLARYYDIGEGPVPEMADDSSYYPDVIRYIEAHPRMGGDEVSGGWAGVSERVRMRRS